VQYNVKEPSLAWVLLVVFVLTWLLLLCICSCCGSFAKKGGIDHSRGVTLN